MKKITILAVFALMAAGASAGQAAAPDSLYYVNVYEEGSGEWGKSPNWFKDRNYSSQLSSWEVAVEGLSASPVAVFDQSLRQAPAEVYNVDLKGDYDIAGLYVDNDTITYRISIPSDNEWTLTGSAGSVFTKRGPGEFYNDARLVGVTTELYEGTIGRNSWNSRFLPVYGEKVVVKGEEATIDVGWKSNESGISSKDRSDNTKFNRLAADIEVPEGSTLNIIGPKNGSGGYFWCDTGKVAKVTGKGTINFRIPGDRFIIGGGSKGEGEMGADFSEFDGTINVMKIGTDSTDVESSKGEYPNLTRDTIKVPVFSHLIFNPVTLKGKELPKEYYSAESGEKLLYNVWLNNREFLDSIFVNMKNVDMHVGNWGSLACTSAGSSGGANITMVRLRSLNVDRTGMIIGYYKRSDPQLLLMFGSDNKNCRIDGTVTSVVSAKEGAAETEGFSMYKNCGVKLIKEGTGTCYLTANDNQIMLGIDIFEGAMMFNNTQYTATGYSPNEKNVVCYKDGTIGGRGSIGYPAELYGTLQPGSNSVDTFTITSENNRIWYRSGKERNSDNPPTHNLARGNEILRAASDGSVMLHIYAGETNKSNSVASAPCLDMEITDKEHHDMIDIQGELRVYEVNEGAITVKVAPRDNWTLNEGDTIELIRANVERAYEMGEKNYEEQKKQDASILPAFKLDVAEGFQAQNVEFELAEVGDRQFNGKDWINVGGWKLLLVVKKGGSGEAPVEPDDEPEPDAIEETEAAASMQVYPNPATDNVTVALPADVTGVVAIYNLAGQLVKSVATTDATVSVNVDDLTAGVYTVLVQTPDKVYNQRLIVR